MKKGDFPIVLGGDHSQGIGSVHGLKQVYPKAKVLWIDAHLDILYKVGNMHGSPLGVLAGLMPGINKPVFNLNKDVYFIGIRQEETYETEIVLK